MSDINKIQAKTVTIDFQELGLNQVAYIRPIRIFDQNAFAIYAANGAPLSIQPSYAEAVAITKLQDLNPATVH